MSPAKKKSTTQDGGCEFIALTVKVDQKTYEHLALLRAKERKTAQAILYDALKEYLSRARS